MLRSTRLVLVLVVCSCGGSNEPGGDANETPGPAVVFVTAATYAGNLATLGGKATGLEGADALCANAGEAALLGRNFKAWLSDESTNAIDRIADVGPWHFATADGSVGSIAFNNKANLSTIPLAPPNVTEQGVMLTTSERAWTGSNAGGTKFPDRNCASWTSGSGVDFGIQGDVRSTSNWTYVTAGECNLPAHLYCIGQ